MGRSSRPVQEGDEVREGAVLFEIDPRPFAATLKQAQANLLQGQGAARPRGRAGEALQGPARRRTSSRPTPTNRCARTWTPRRRRVRARRGDDREREAVSSSTARSASPVTGYAGKHPDPAGQPGQGQRHQPAGDDQPDRCRSMRRSRCPSRTSPTSANTRPTAMLQVQAGFANSVAVR